MNTLRIPTLQCLQSVINLLLAGIERYFQSITRRNEKHFVSFLISGIQNHFSARAKFTTETQWFTSSSLSLSLLSLSLSTSSSSWYGHGHHHFETFTFKYLKHNLKKIKSLHLYQAFCCGWNTVHQYYATLHTIKHKGPVVKIAILISILACCI